MSPWSQTWHQKPENFLEGYWPYVHDASLGPGISGDVLLSEKGGAAGAIAGQSIWWRDGRSRGERGVIFLLTQPLYLSYYHKVPPTVWVGPTSIKVVKTILQVRLPTQEIRICGKWTLKPTMKGSKLNVSEGLTWDGFWIGWKTLTQRERFQVRLEMIKIYHIHTGNTQNK